MFSMAGLPNSWRQGAHTRLVALGSAGLPMVSDSKVRSNLDCGPSEGIKEPMGADKAHVWGSTSLLMSKQYSADGFWPPLRLEAHFKASSGRPGTGFKQASAGVVDRIFNSPFAVGTKEEYVRKIKANMNKKVSTSKRMGAASLTNFDSPESYPQPDKADKGKGLDVVATAIFNDSDSFGEGKRPKSRRGVKQTVQKLNYAEKLQIMIMQVQDTIEDLNQDVHL